MNQKRKYCGICCDSYHSHYFSQHKCTTNNEHEQVDEDTQSNTSNTEVDFDFACENNRTTDDEGDDEIDQDLVEDEEYEELLQDFHVPINGLNYGVLENKHNIIFATWLCIYLVVWQYAFGITDTSLELLLKFLKSFFDVIAEKYPGLGLFAASLPPSLYLLHKKLQINEQRFVKYVVCIKCKSLHKFESCFEMIRGVNESKRCNHVSNPNHRLKQYRKPCDQLLLMTIQSLNGKTVLYPFKTYCYKPLKISLQELVGRKNFEKSCEEWRNRNTHDDVMSDVYDGKIWSSFNNEEEHDFFTKPRNYGVIVNLDWFAPFKHVSNFSVGAIYLVIMNLPRCERFKRKNLILVGLIPNMDKEPPTNTFMQPLVEELKEAWDPGFQLKSSTSETFTYRAALICIGCDVPACRKLCGFLGHSATVGCSRCKKQFPGDIGQKDYSGFDRQNWISRTTEQHRSEMNKINDCSTIGEKSRLESELGTRYSVLTELSYYDSIRMAIIDPMHNLFLGTAKKMIVIWKDIGYLNNKTFPILQQRVDAACVPSDIGKLPTKLQSGFDGFTADELKNWTVIFSIYALKGIIPKRDLECWRCFVIACFYLCNRVITIANIKIADNYLIKFCKEFENIYGTDKVTPNMHLHGHLVECIYDFGPIYSFWLFSFERYNGLMGSIPNNKRNIEVQMMKRFCRDGLILNIDVPNEYYNDFCTDITKLKASLIQRGTLNTVEFKDYIPFMKLSSKYCDFSKEAWFDCSFVRSTRKWQHYTIPSYNHTCLQKCYKAMYPDLQNYIVSESAWKTSELYVADVVYGSRNSRSSRSSYILAYWCGNDGNVCPYQNIGFDARPGQILYFLKHILYVDEAPYEHHLAFVEWYLPLPDCIKNRYGKPVQVWRNKLFVVLGSASFIPVQRIKTKFVYVEKVIDSTDVIVVLPRFKALDY